MSDIMVVVDKLNNALYAYGVEGKFSYTYASYEDYIFFGDSCVFSPDSDTQVAEDDYRTPRQQVLHEMQELAYELQSAIAALKKSE